MYAPAEDADHRPAGAGPEQASFPTTPGGGGRGDLPHRLETAAAEG